MKKHIIILCIFTTISGMEQQLIRQPREWNPQAYDNGNELQTIAFLHFLKTNNIQTKNKTILDVGCGTGKISAQLTQESIYVHGFDASKNMIDFAQHKYGHIKNLSFEHCFAEDFTSPKRYQLALASFSVHWFENREQAFQRINDSLEINGEFFATVCVKNEKAITLTNTLKKIPNFEATITQASHKKFDDLIVQSYPLGQELDMLLEKTGFKLLKRESQSCAYKLDKDEFKKLHWPIFSSRPFIDYISDELIQNFFESYVNLLEKEILIDNNGKLICNFTTNIVHAQKIHK